MSSIVTKKLTIDNDNIAQYCDADNVSFNVSGHAWRKWLNGSTDGYIILKTEGKAVLYPTDIARPFKADSTISASRSAGTCTVDLQFGGTQVHEESYTSGSQTSKSKTGITDAAVTNSTKATEIKWHVYGKNGDNQRGNLLELTLYFYQYTMQPKAADGVNGIQSVSVSNTAPYYGDSVTFSAELVSGATWHGWYSDAACTSLVSADQAYTVSPSSDITLYASATIDTATYACAAIAKDGVTSVTVSDSVVPDGGECIFSAQPDTGYVFEGWYSDEGCTNVVSAENPYTATITADTTLYAKARLSKLKISVGQAEHGTASVNTSVINYGDNVVFTFTPESDDYKLYGWYSDEGLTQFVSEANPYTCTPTTDYKLYPKVGIKTYKITLTRGLKTVAFGKRGTWTLKIAALYYDKLTRDEIQYAKTGEFDKIDTAKIHDQTVKTGSDMIAAITASLLVPANATCVIWCSLSSMPVTCFSETSDNDAGERDFLTNWPYYIFKPSQDKEYFCYCSETACICAAIVKRGVQYADATTPTFAGKTAVFSATIKDGYTFVEWYSDEACTTLVSSDNPANVVTPTVSSGNETTLTLYALAKSLVGTGLYFKQNGAYAEAKAIYQKVNGAWTAVDKTVFNTTTKYKIIKT